MLIDEEYFKSEEFRELLDSYEATVEQDMTPFLDVEDLVDIADYYSWQGDPESADEAVDYALDLYPLATLPNVFKAREALLDRDFKNAHRWLEAIQDHDDPDYHYLYAEILIAEGHVDKADRYLRDYGRTVPPDEYEDFIRDCANLYIDYGVSDKAYEWMMRSRADESDDFKELMARTLYGMGRYKDSERLFNELIEQHPYSKHYWNALAATQMMNEDYPNAITSSEYAIAIDPNDLGALSQKAEGLFRLYNYDEALKYFRRYSELAPDDEYGLLYQGYCLLSLNRNEEALSIFRQAQVVAPNDSPYRSQILQELALCYGMLHQLKQALEELDKTDALDCDHTEMLVVRGHVLLLNDKWEESQEAFKQAIIKSKNSPKMMLRIVSSLYDNRYVKASYEMLLTLLDIVDKYYPDYKAGNAYMALCCYDLKRDEEFLKYLRLAVEKNPREAQGLLSFLFPAGMPVTDYVSYMEQRLSAQNPS